MSLGTAIKSRWDACGFNTTISQIRLSKRNLPAQTAANQGVQGSAPASALLPRAEFSVSDSDPVLDTSAATLQEAFVFIDCWRKASEIATLTADMILIRDKFNNSHQATANPFDMGASELAQQVSFVGNRYEILDNDIVHSETCLVVRFSYANAVPA